ncbi:MAG: SDR family oxidoreductase [Brevinematales bacterium]|jgi:NAD(P)-dependent dehydrogenase (short-subunit alcohol dehydrogenase family)
MEDIKNSVILITGATNGIGKATAERLAGLGATVVIHGRDQVKINSVINEIKGRTGSRKIDGIRADLASLKEVKSMAEEFKSRFDRLDVLINNAGGVFLDGGPSKDTFEITFAVNYLSHFLLTSLLLGLLKKSTPSRVILVSSEAHRFLGHVNLDKVSEPGFYKGFSAYSAAKICENLFAFELADRLKESGVDSNALHPGVVRTGFGLNTKNSFFKALLRIFGLFIITPEQGSDTSVFLASSPEVKGITGKYFNKCKPFIVSKNSLDAVERKRLWDISEKLLESYL